MRIVRLALGIFITAQGIVNKDWTFGLLGIAFTMMPLLNIGCCGASGCNVPREKASRSIEDVSYEEVH